MNTQSIVPLLYLSGLSIQSHLFEVAQDYSRQGRQLNSEMLNESKILTNQTCIPNNSEIVAKQYKDQVQFKTLLKLQEFNYVCQSHSLQYYYPIAIPLTLIYPKQSGALFAFMFLGQSLFFMYDFAKFKWDVDQRKQRKRNQLFQTSLKYLLGGTALICSMVLFKRTSQALLKEIRAAQMSTTEVAVTQESTNNLMK